MLVLTQPAHSYSHVSMPTRAWPACVFKRPYLPSLEACSYLLSPVQANTCPHLLMPALTCPHLSRLTPAHICLHLSLPSVLTPALTCSCPYLLVPVQICPCLPMPTSAHACIFLLSPVHVHTCPYLLTPALTCPHLPSLAYAHTCQSSTPPMSFRITSCFPTTLGLLFFLFQRLLSPFLSWIPASYPQPPLRMTLLCARARSLS